MSGTDNIIPCFRALVKAKPAQRAERGRTSARRAGFRRRSGARAAARRKSHCTGAKRKFCAGAESCRRRKSRRAGEIPLHGRHGDDRHLPQERPLRGRKSHCTDAKNPVRRENPAAGEESCRRRKARRTGARIPHGRKSRCTTRASGFSSTTMIKNPTQAQIPLCGRKIPARAQKNPARTKSPAAGEKNPAARAAGQTGRSRAISP